MRLRQFAKKRQTDLDSMAMCTTARGVFWGGRGTGDGAKGGRDTIDGAKGAGNKDQGKRGQNKRGRVKETGQNRHGTRRQGHKVRGKRGRCTYIHEFQPFYEGLSEVSERVKRA